MSLLKTKENNGNNNAYCMKQDASCLHDKTVKFNEIWEIISDSENGYHLFVHTKTARETSLLTAGCFKFPKNL